MIKRPSSMRWRSLARRGIVNVRQPVAAPPLPQTRLQKYSEWAKHPALLVSLGFALTGVLGKLYSDWTDQQRRQRDAAVKTGDDLRASVDDITAISTITTCGPKPTFTTKEIEAPSKVIDADRAELQSSYYRWSERYGGFNRSTQRIG